MGTQEDAAALLGLSVETIYRIENGQYYWATIDREIKALIECRLGPFPIYKLHYVPHTFHHRHSTSFTEYRSSSPGLALCSFHLGISLGPFPIYEEIEVPETRAGATTAYLDDIEKEIAEFLSETGIHESGEDTQGSTTSSKRGGSDYHDTLCDRCPTMLGPRDERCPNCQRNVDGSH